MMRGYYEHYRGLAEKSRKVQKLQKEINSMMTRIYGTLDRIDADDDTITWLEDEFYIDFEYATAENVVDSVIDEGDHHRMTDKKFIQHLMAALHDERDKLEDAYDHVVNQIAVMYDEVRNLIKYANSKVKKLPKNIKRRKTTLEWHIHLYDSDTGGEFHIRIMSDTEDYIYREQGYSVVWYDRHDLLYKAGVKKVMNDIDDAFDEAIEYLALYE